MKTKWRARLRLWGKKRGGRMTGWWFIGSLGEALFFAAVFLIGVFLSAILVSWQLMSQSTQPLKIGYGFWLFLGVCLSFVVMGIVGFWYRVLKVVTSDEHREVLDLKSILPQPLKETQQTKRVLTPPTIPDVKRLTDSPGARLAYRLPSQIPENGALVALGVFAMAWNAMIAVFLVIAAENFLRSQVPWQLILLLVPGIYVAIRSARLFFRSFIRTLGIGSTTVEIQDLPLLPGREYGLEVVQYGRLVIKKITVRLECQEESTYHFGTDLRTERQTVFSQEIASHGRDRIDWGYPLRMECRFAVPQDAMHSFQSKHNAVHWKIVVSGEANRWPSYSRSFPVIVYPQPNPSRAIASS
jgi:hypothetical protein